jgi:VanZ family protein
MGMLYWFSSLSDVPSAPAMLSDKGMHFLAYAGLAVVSVRALARARWRGVTRLACAGATIIASAYGVFDELHQTWVPGRTFDSMDIAADAIGAVAASVTLYAWGIIRVRRYVL